MPSLKAIRKRIVSVKNTQKITKAMKMVAAAKLRRAQDSVQAIRPYAQRLGQLAADLARHVANEPLADAESAAPSSDTATPATQGAADAAGGGGMTARHLQRILIGQSEQRIRLVVVTSDRGLAGAYNSNVLRRTERFLVERADSHVDLLILGKKGRDYYRRRRRDLITAELPGVDPKSSAERAQQLASLLVQALGSEKSDAIYVVYNEFKSVGSQVIKVDRLLPLQIATQATGNAGDQPPLVLLDFLYEPSREAVIEQLLPRYLTAALHRILLEAIAAEFAAKLSAMDNASRNAKEMISRLTLQYNRARQAAITKELMEIIGGAEALKG